MRLKCDNANCKREHVYPNKDEFKKGDTVVCLISLEPRQIAVGTIVGLDPEDTSEVYIVKDARLMTPTEVTEGPLIRAHACRILGPFPHAVKKLHEGKPPALVFSAMMSICEHVMDIGKTLAALNSFIFTGSALSDILTVIIGRPRGSEPDGEESSGGNTVH